MLRLDFVAGNTWKYFLILLIQSRAPNTRRKKYRRTEQLPREVTHLEGMRFMNVANFLAVEPFDGHI